MEASPNQRLRAYVDYLRDMGVYDLYAREASGTVLSAEARAQLLEAAAKVSLPAPAAAGQAPRAASATPSSRVSSPVARPQPPNAAAPRAAMPSVRPVPQAANEPVFFGDDAPPPLPENLAAPMPRPKSFEELAPLPTKRVTPAEKPVALQALRAEIGDCTRCPLAYAGRHNIVLADGDPNASLMFIGEGPGADEDATGLPFVGKAGQLLNNMITAMGVKREEVYIANIVKCRPPENRAPEYAEATTCSPFLLKQIDIVQPKVIVALGKTAANYLRGNLDSLTSQRGQWFNLRGSKLVVTFHPAYLLRDPRQKAEAWKDLQMVMAELGLKAPAKKA
ncbi:MAG: uracil-DNA glycosylase [Acidobacteriaceae bacterium]|nr:uracil-DNA glycosylase [Acidobacteriaceae bacterium]